MTVRITKFNANPNSASYLLDALGCEEGADDAERAAEIGDGAGYLAAQGDETSGVLRGGKRALAALGLAPGKVSKETALALLRCKNPNTGESLGRAVAAPPDRDELLRRRFAEVGREHLTEDEARAIAREVDRDLARSGSAFFDVTFAPSKSVSVAWGAALAAGDDATAEALESAHRDAMRDAMDHMRSVTTARRYEPGSQVPIFENVEDGILTLEFQHSTSRAREPHLHSHVAVVAKTVGEDGQWRSLYSNGWKAFKADVSAVYESRLAELIEERTDFRMELRPDGMARELVGMPEELVAQASTRTRETVEAYTAARNRFIAEHGREPTPAETRSLHRVAGLESREAKSDIEPLEQIREHYSRHDVDTGELLEQLAAAGQEHDVLYERVADEARAVEVALTVVQERQSTWTRDLLAAEIERRLPAGMHQRALELAAEAVDPRAGYGVVNVSRREPGDVPLALIDPQRGEAVWRAPEHTRYALGDQLRAEAELAAMCRAETITPWTDGEVDEQFAEWHAEGLVGNAQQEEAIRAVLTSPRAGDALVAAAGTGKSWVAGRIARAWTARGGQVMGTATSQVAAGVLGAEGVDDSLNASRFLRRYGIDDESAGERLPAGTLLMFDEAGMTSTAQLRDVLRVAERDGAKVVLTGDPRQLESVGGAGGLAEIVRQNGPVASMDTVMRFEQDWERDASVRLRAGDVSVLEEYARRGRIHSGEAEAMRTQAVGRAVADIVRGRSSMIITEENADAAALSADVQQHLVDLGLLGHEVLGATHDGNHVVTGDRLQWRHRNVQDLDTEDGRELTNREILRAEGLDDRGRVVCTRESTGARVYIPTEYLAEYTSLAYAGTEHAAQGVTLDVGHAMVPGYVAMTRGKIENNAWLTTVVPGDVEEGRERFETTPQALFEQWAYKARQAEEASALATWRAELDAGEAADAVAGAYETTVRHVIRTSARELYASLGGGDAVVLSGRSEGGRAALEAALTEAEMHGHDHIAVFAEAWNSRPIDLDEVRDLDALMARRITSTLRDRTPERVADTWRGRSSGFTALGSAAGTFIGECAARMDARQVKLAEDQYRHTRPWVLEALGGPPDDPEQLAEWKRRAGQIAFYREQRSIADIVPSVGARPHEHDVITQTAWNDAARAGGRPVDEMTYRAAPDSQLRGWRALWAQITARAPIYVEDELDRVSRAVAQAAADRAVLEHELARTGDEHMAAEVERLGELEAVAAERQRALDEIAETRRAWEREHEQDRDRAVEAERELKRRGRIVDGEELEPGTELLQGDEDQQVDSGEVERPERGDDEAEVQQALARRYFVDREPTARDLAGEQAVEDRSYDDPHDRGGRDILSPYVAKRSAEQAQMSLAEAEARAEVTRRRLEEREREKSARDATLEAEQVERDQRWERDQAAERDLEVEQTEPERTREQEIGL